VFLFFLSRKVTSEQRVRWNDNIKMVLWKTCYGDGRWMGFWILSSDELGISGVETSHSITTELVRSGISTYMTSKNAISF
jgi:hypothetical protein